MTVVGVSGVMVGAGTGAGAVASVQPRGGGLRGRVLGDDSVGRALESHELLGTVVDQLAHHRAVVAHSVNLAQGISRGRGKRVEGAGCLVSGAHYGRVQEKDNDDGRNETAKAHGIVGIIRAL